MLSFFRLLIVFRFVSDKGCEQDLSLVHNGAAHALFIVTVWSSNLELERIRRLKWEMVVSALFSSQRLQHFQDTNPHINGTNPLTVMIY